jgi:hypothetical protein
LLGQALVDCDQGIAMRGDRIEKWTVVEIAPAHLDDAAHLVPT